MNNLIINGHKIKKPSGIIYVFSNLQNNNVVVDGDKNEIINLLEITDQKITPDSLINFFITFSKNIRSLINYISHNKEDLDIERMCKFIEYKKIKPSDSNSEKALKLMYGDKIGSEKFKQQQTKFSKYYDIDYYINLGFSITESLEKIEEFKKNKSTTIENFVKKYGKKIGKQKYQDYVNKSKNTIDNFKKRYGDEWEVKWNHYISKDSSSLNWALKKTNGNDELAQKIFKDKIAKTTITLELLQDKYGVNQGLKKWEEIKRKRNTSDFNFFLEKYKDYEIAKEKYHELNSKKDSSSLNFFIKKYGNDGYDRYKKKCKLSDNKSLNFFLEKFKDYQTAYNMYVETQKTIKVKHLSASKASLLIFQPLYDYLINNNIFNINDIYLGIEGSKEFFLRSDRNIYFYDFTIKSKNLIIEYNGKAWHPNWEKYDIKECVENFKFSLVDPIEVINNDKNKIELAKKNGFDVLVLWEEDGLQFNQQKLKDFLNKKQINYENKKNN